MNELSLTHSAPRVSTRLVGVVAGLVVYAGVTAVLYRGISPELPSDTRAVQLMSGAKPPRRNVAVADGRFLVDGAEFYIRAVGWDPARPGELPWQRRWSREEVESDFRRIRAAGFNTLRTWAALTPEELALAEAHRLRVLQGVWVPPDADYSNPAVRRSVLAEVSQRVEASRWSPAIVGYLVMNEPRASAVASAGLENTRAFLREVVATVRALDPSAPIGFANWPGLEALDDDLLDFVAFNIYPHRPRVLMDELGLAGYVRLVDRKLARGRPLIVSEFGVSVSPERPEGMVRRGGATEDEQALELVQLARTFVGAGVAGTAVFQWNDGWWKNNDGAGDERTHDTADPEEWFGLLRFSGIDDRTGTARPALAALEKQNRATLLLPRDGEVEPKAPVRIFSEAPVTLHASISGGAWTPVDLKEKGRGWRDGVLPLGSDPARHDVAFRITDADGAVVRTEHRLLRVGARKLQGLTLSFRHTRVSSGLVVPIEVHAQGAELAGRSITVAAYTEDRYNEQRLKVQLDDTGRARLSVTAPMGPTFLTVVAFEDDPEVPPAERHADFATIEVASQ